MKKESMVGRRLYAKVLDILLLVILVFFFDGMVSKSLMNKVSDNEIVAASYVEHSKEYEKIQDEYQIYIYDTDGNRKYNENITEEVKNAFLNDERINELNVVLLQEQKQIIWYFIYRMLFSIFVPAFLIYGIIPIFLKDGKTLGRLIAKLVVINKNGEPLKWHKTLLRALCSIVFNIYLTIITLGMVPLISLVVSVAHKENRSIVDLVSGTKVIDGKLPYIWQK